MAKIKVQIEMDVKDDASQDDTNELLGAIAAQVEDDEPGIITWFRMDVEGAKDW